MIAKEFLEERELKVKSLELAKPDFLLSTLNFQL